MARRGEADVALLQESGGPPGDLAHLVRYDDSFVAASLYARYMKPHPSTGTPWSVVAADVSVLSELSAFIGHENPSKHRILAAGDLNIFCRATGDALSLPAGRHEERPDLLQPAAALAGQCRPPNRAGGSSGCWGMREDRNQKRRPICDTLRGQIRHLKDWADARQAVGAPCPVSFRIVPGMLAWNVSEHVGRNPSPA